MTHLLYSLGQHWCIIVRNILVLCLFIDWPPSTQKLPVLETRWKDIEACDSQIIPGFYDWFVQHKLDMIKSTMLRPVREEAGLGCPPQPFTTNPSEAVNAVNKNQVNYKSHQLIQFIEHLKEVIDEQDREVERAITGRGKYHFKEQYSFPTDSRVTVVQDDRKATVGSLEESIEYQSGSNLKSND